MLKIDIQIVRDEWASHQPPMPESFILLGRHSPYVLTTDGHPLLVIDAEGIILTSGAVYTWCRTGCCNPDPRKWPTIDAAAEYHGSCIVHHDGTITAPGDNGD